MYVTAFALRPLAGTAYYRLLPKDRSKIAAKNVTASRHSEHQVKAESESA